MNVIHSAGGRHTAYIRAREGADIKQLENIKKSLTLGEMQWTPVTTKEGEHLLEVRNVGRYERKLLRYLTDAGAVSTDEYRKEESPEGKVSVWEKVKANTLRYSGWSYLVGDIGFISYGWSEAFEKVGGKSKLNNPQLLLAGLFYAVGSPFTYLFGGGDKSDMQLRNMSYATLGYLESTGVKVPEGSSIHSIPHMHNSSAWRQMINKAQRYPAEFANSFYGLAGAMIIWDGAKNLSKHRRETAAGGNPVKSRAGILMDIGLGVTTVMAGLVSDLVPEQPRREGEPRKPGLAGMWQWVQEKPLRVAGALLGISTASQAGSTIVGYTKAQSVINNPNSTPEQIDAARQNRKALGGRSVFVATNFSAEALMAASSKGHGRGVESDVSLEPSVYAVMADMILHSPEENRGSLLDTISGHLSQKEHLNLDKDRIKKGIAEQMEGIARNPWLGLSVPGKKESNVTQEPEQQNTKWQDSVANSATIAAVPGVRT